MKKINLFAYPALTVVEMRERLAGQRIFQDGQGNFFVRDSQIMSAPDMATLKRQQRRAYEHFRKVGGGK